MELINAMTPIVYINQWFVGTTTQLHYDKIFYKYTWNEIKNLTLIAINAMKPIVYINQWFVGTATQLH